MTTVSELLATLPADSGLRGAAFERLCRWFLTNDPVYAAQIKQAWLWDDWPDRWGRDAGIDLVAETHDGDLWAIQAKAYAPTTQVTKADIDSFLSESNREQFAFRLLIASTDRVGGNARQVIRGQQKPASLLLRSDLEARTLDWPSHVDGKPPRSRKPFSPRPHQAEALKAIRTVKRGQRGRVIMACGTGKTMVQLWAHEQFKSSRTLVLVPSLFLVAQSIQEWTANRRRPFEFLAVCSDDTVVAGADSFVSHVSEIGLPVTTDPEQIKAFLEGAGDRVVFSTYQSSSRIAAAVAGTSLRFELALADEAHQLAGNVSRDFAAVLDESRIPTDRRLFFTATPRYYTGKTVKVDGESDLQVASMDDEAAFGPEIHRLSFGEAIERELLSDYRIVVVGVTDQQAYELAEQGAFVEFEGEQTDARTLAREIGLAKAMHDFELHRLISFHSRVNLARQFAAHLPDVVAKLPAERSPQGALVFDYVSGEMATGDRRNRLNRLRNISDDEYALLANARCLSEGVDVPSIDGVAFIDPRRSQVDIVQAVGRAIRLSANKTLGTIVIPVFVPEGEDPETVLSDSAFEPVWAVVRALRDHDERLAEELDAARRKLGRERKLTRDDLPGHLFIDFPDVVVGQAFIDAIATRVVEVGSASWEAWFARLEDYVAEHGSARPTASWKTSEGLALGSWVARQRDAFQGDRLENTRRVHLEGLPAWSWDPREEQWAAGFDALQRYVQINGTSTVPAQCVFDHFRLGQWVQVQRVRREELSTERRSSLEQLPGWQWPTGMQRIPWEQVVSLLAAYVDEHGNAHVPKEYRPNGFALASWVGRQRAAYAERTLTQEQIRQLTAVQGWTWDSSRDSRWGHTFAALQGFAAELGDPKVPANYERGGIQFANWVHKQRRDYTTGRLSLERVSLLERIAGWTWDPFEDAWEEGFAALQQYAVENRNTRLPQSFVTLNGFALGRWIAKQRAAHRARRLDSSREQRLSLVPGWTWDPYADDWEEGFAALERYAAENGNAHVPGGFVTSDGFRLGQWVVVQRVARKAQRLDVARERRLSIVTRWTW